MKTTVRQFNVKEDHAGMKVSFLLNSLIGIILAISAVICLSVKEAIASDGNTIIAKWKDNKKGAFSLRFDDSMMSQRDHTIPNLIDRELVGSFFINPATNRYGYGIDSWESLASRNGLELCPHTMNHTGAADLAEADYEIGEAFRVVWSLNPPDKSKLLPFARGGGTTWPSGYRDAILNKYPVADYNEDAVRYSGPDNAKELIAFAKEAIKKDLWHMILTHGTGPHYEWLGFNVDNFEALLDYLASVKGTMWIGTIGDVYKYVTERKSAKVVMVENTGSIIRLDLISDADPELFDYPLTLITQVPAIWKFCHVQQSELQHIYPVSSGKVMYGAIPGRGEIVLKGADMDTTPPSSFTVRDGTLTDIDESMNTTVISANWDSPLDEESGISRYWYKVGTAPGSSDVLDWIDNGRVRNFTTSRTHFSLVRGEKYYITIKAVNGVGLSTESTSNGMTIDNKPGYISFREDFDNGYLTQWNEKRTRIGSEKNLIYISGEAAHTGNYGLQCHLQDSQNGTPYIAVHDITPFRDIFTRFYFKLGIDFTIPEKMEGIQLLELKDISGDYVAGVYLGYSANAGYYIQAVCLDNTGYRMSLPGLREDYPMSFIKVEPDNWHRVDIRTIADKDKGGAEFWFDGDRKGTVYHRPTGGKKVESLYIGALRIPENNISGDIYFDDISVSDSKLK